MTRYYRLSNDDLEQIVVLVFAKLESAGLVIRKDCDVTLARAVAVELRKIYEDKEKG